MSQSPDRRFHAKARLQPRYPGAFVLARRCLLKRERLRRTEIPFLHGMAAKALRRRPTKAERERLLFIAWRVGVDLETQKPNQEPGHGS
jgi:hypothetical protein